MDFGAGNVQTKAHDAETSAAIGMALTQPTGRSWLTVTLLFLICLPAGISSVLPSGQRNNGLPSGGAKFGFAAVAPRMDSYNAVPQVKIAAVEPVFTSTAYSSFYTFYSRYSQTPPNRTVTTDLNLLNASLVYNWGWSDGLRRFLTSNAASAQYNLTLGQNLFLISDVNVTEGALFAPDGTRNFDVVILGFSEYVTAQQYSSYKRFVESGGVLIFMGATNFLAEVAYYPGTQHLALVRGHSWRFNGTSALRDVMDRWRRENTDWIASSYWYQVGASYKGAIPVDNNPIGRALKAKFSPRVFTSYGGHEENHLTNLTDTSIIAHWLHPSTGRDQIVAAYLHHYKNSYLIHFGVMGSDVVAVDVSVQEFLAQSVLFAANSMTVTPPISYHQNSSSVSFYSNSSKGLILFNGTIYSHGRTGNYTYTSHIASVHTPFGYRFHNWSSAGGLALVDPALSSSEVIVTGSGSLTVNFRAVNETITIAISFHTNGKSGSIVCGDKVYTNGQAEIFLPRTSIICTAYPAGDLKFTGWSGLASDTSNPVALNTKDGGSLTANFTPLSPSAFEPRSITLALIALASIVFVLTRSQKQPSVH